MELWKKLSSKLVKNKSSIKRSKGTAVSYVTDGEKQGTGISIPLQSSAEEFHSKICQQLVTLEKRRRLLKAISNYAKTSNIKRFIKRLDALAETNTDLLDVIRNVVFEQHKSIYDDHKARKLFNLRNEKHVVQIIKGDDQSMGFKIRGGKEYGVGFYVTSVKPNSPADIAGLKPGDEIFCINDLPIQESIKDELLEIFRSKDSMSLVVKSSGVYPIKKEGKIEWISVNESLSKESKDVKDRIVSIAIGSQGFGCKIRRLSEYDGVYVISVKDNSLAQKIGVKVGDKVLNINGRDFQNISHQEALDIIQSARNLSIVLTFNEDVKEYLQQIQKKESNNGIESNIEEILKESEDAKKDEASYVASHLHDKRSYVSSHLHDEGSFTKKENIDTESKDDYEYKLEEIEQKKTPEETEKYKKSYSTKETEKYEKIYTRSAQQNSSPKNLNVAIVQESENEKLNVKNELSKKSNQPISTSILRSNNTNNTNKTAKHTIFAESVNVEIIEVEKFENEDEDDEVILPDSSNFNYSKDFLNGREVHYVSIPKGSPMGMELTQKGNIVAVKSVNATGAVGTHGFIQPGDWLLNAEGDDLIGKDVTEVNKILSGVLQRWSKHIELIVACSPGREPPKLPTKKDSSELFRDASILYASIPKEQTISSDDSTLEISSCSELSMDFILPKIHKVKRDEAKVQLDDELEVGDKLLTNNEIHSNDNAYRSDNQIYSNHKEQANYKTKSEETVVRKIRQNNMVQPDNEISNYSISKKHKKSVPKTEQLPNGSLNEKRVSFEIKDSHSENIEMEQQNMSPSKNSFSISSKIEQMEKPDFIKPGFIIDNQNTGFIIDNQKYSSENQKSNIKALQSFENKTRNEETELPEENVIRHSPVKNVETIKQKTLSKKRLFSKNNEKSDLEKLDSLQSPNSLYSSDETSPNKSLKQQEEKIFPEKKLSTRKRSTSEKKKFSVKSSKNKEEKAVKKKILFNTKKNNLSIKNIAADDNVVKDVIADIFGNQLVSPKKKISSDNATADFAHFSETNSTVLKNASEISENKDSLVVLENKTVSSVQNHASHKENIDELENLTDSIQKTDCSIKNTPFQEKNKEPLKNPHSPIKDTDALIKSANISKKKVESPFFEFEKQVTPNEKKLFHTSKTDLSGISQTKQIKEKNDFSSIKQKAFSEVGVQTELEHPSSVLANDGSGNSVFSSSSVLVENKLISHKYTLFSYNKNEEEKIKSMRKTNLNKLQKNNNSVPLNDVFNENERQALTDLSLQNFCSNCLTLKTFDNKTEHANKNVIYPSEQKAEEAMAIPFSTSSLSDKNVITSSTSSITNVPSKPIVSSPKDLTPIVSIATPKSSPYIRNKTRIQMSNNVSISKEFSDKKLKNTLNVKNKHLFDSYNITSSHLNFSSLTKYSPRIPEKEDSSILVGSNYFNESSNLLMETVEKKIQTETEISNIKISTEEKRNNIFNESKKNDSFNEPNFYRNNEVISFLENKKPSVQPLLIKNTFTKKIFTSSKNPINKISNSKNEIEKIEEQINFNQNLFEDKSIDGFKASFNGKVPKAFLGNKADILSFLNTKIDVSKNDFKTFSVAEINKNFRKENILDVKEPLYIDDKKTEAETVLKKEKTVCFDGVTSDTKKDLLFVSPSSNVINKHNKKDLKIRSADSIREITLSSYSKATYENQHSIIFTKSVLLQPNPDNYLKQNYKQYSNRKSNGLNVKKNNDPVQNSNQSVSNQIEQNDKKISKNNFFVENQNTSFEAQPKICDIEFHKTLNNEPETQSVDFQSNEIEFCENLNDKVSSDVASLTRSNSFPLNLKNALQLTNNDLRQRSHSIVSSRKEIKSILQKYNKKTLSKKVKFAEFVTVDLTTPPNSEFGSEEENN
ncbi:metacaspase-2 isoform X7 [Hydra vulgaris]|uniref:Metacaspase-2 isoform X7 n=1 Tax=Hydra vulgaris TaxID=6087 RepID=A0ABM4BEK5_HYDVU